MVASEGQESTNRQEERSSEIAPNRVDGETSPQTQGLAQPIRRKTPRNCGIYVKGSIYDVPVWYTIDTGASRTVVSSRIYNTIDPVKNPPVTGHVHISLEQANGTP